MSFVFNVTTNTQTTGGERKEVDWSALNAHVIDAAGTANKPRSIPGIISGIYDLGEQEREDAEQVFLGDSAAEEREIAAKPATYFKDGFDPKTNKPARMKCWPQKAVQQVAVAIDFPQILVDKGQFFGNSSPLPLRMIMNGDFRLSDGTQIVGRPYSISETKHEAENQWAFAKNNGLHKLADAAGILDPKGLFKKERIGELLGKVAQFQFRIYMKPNKKDASKSYFTEEIKLVGMVPEGVPLPEAPEGILHGVNLYGQNDPEAVKQLRVSIKNTIKRANNYAGSDLAALLDAQGGAQKPVIQGKPAATVATVDDADFDEDLPF